MKENSIIFGKAFEFAIEIVKISKILARSEKEFVISKQLLKSGTSIGANISEALGGISQKDFSSKMSIAYKESLETKYWLKLLNKTGYLQEGTFSFLHAKNDEISRILFSILKTTRLSNKN
ncbi:MAG: four helix bundle protein [Bacteroidetes bacterium]|nr:four helix bundle protein [Bacteroidota bacterium]